MKLADCKPGTKVKFTEKEIKKADADLANFDNLGDREIYTVVKLIDPKVRKFNNEKYKTEYGTVIIERPHLFEDEMIQVYLHHNQIEICKDQNVETKKLKKKEDNIW